MMLRLFGAALIVASCSGFGFYIAARYKKEVFCLRKLSAIIQFIEWELEYRLTPLPQVCSSIADKTRFYFSAVFRDLGNALSFQISPDVAMCMHNILLSQNDIPRLSRHYLEILGETLGEYDVDGQLKSLAQLRQSINNHLDEMKEGQKERLRCYQTLGVCAGAALAILFV